MIRRPSIEIPLSELSNTNYETRKGLPVRRNDDTVPAPPSGLSSGKHVMFTNMEREDAAAAVRLSVDIPDSEALGSKFETRRMLPVRRTDEEVPAPPSSAAHRSAFSHHPASLPPRPEDADYEAEKTSGACQEDANPPAEYGSALAGKPVGLSVDVSAPKIQSSNFESRKGLPVRRNDEDVPAPPNGSFMKSQSIFVDAEQPSDRVVSRDSMDESRESKEFANGGPVQMSLQIPSMAQEESTNFGNRRGLPVRRTDDDIPPPPSGTSSKEPIWNSADSEAGHNGTGRKAKRVTKHDFRTPADYGNGTGAESSGGAPGGGASGGGERGWRHSQSSWMTAVHEAQARARWASSSRSLPSSPRKNVHPLQIPEESSEFCERLRVSARLGLPGPRSDLELPPPPRAETAPYNIFTQPSRRSSARDKNARRSRSLSETTMSTVPMDLLLVDDQVSVLKLYSSQLESSSLAVFTAQDGMQALDLMKKRMYVVAFVDMAMPKLNGTETVTRLRKWENANRTQSQYVVAISATGYNDVQKKQLLMYGFDQIVVKGEGAIEQMLDIVSNRLKILENNAFRD